MLHASGDIIVPIAEGHILAAGSRARSLSSFESKNHVLLENEPAWERFCDEVQQFVELGGSNSRRRSRIRLALLAREGSANVNDGGFGQLTDRQRLSISEKTVRNHVSNLFDKLGVWTRAQAIVFAIDRGFRR